MHHQANLAEVLLEVIVVDVVDGAEDLLATRKVSVAFTQLHTNDFGATEEILQFELNANPV